MCGLTNEDWMIMRGMLEDRHEPHRALVLSGMLSAHEADVAVMASEQRWKEAGDTPALRLEDSMRHEAQGYLPAEFLIHPNLRRNKWIDVRRYRASDRVWAFSEQGYGGRD